MDSLPVEILTHIFRYLCHSDRISCTLVSKTFHSAFMDPKITKSSLVHVDFCSLNHFLCSFKDEGRVISLKLGSNVSITKKGYFYSKIKDIIIESPDAFQLIRFMPALTSIEVNNSGKAVTFVLTPEVKENLRGVTCLKISQNFEQLEELLDALPNLKFLHLEGFTCKSQKSFNRSTYLSLKTLQSCLKQDIQGLMLKSYCVEPSSSENFILNLFTYNLKDLAITIDGVEAGLVMTLLAHHDLHTLDLTCWNGFNPGIFQVISCKATLKSLTLRGKISTVGLDISKLRLDVLKFKDTFDNEDHMHLLGSIRNVRELEIDTICLNSTECVGCVVKFVENNPDVMVLNLSKSKIDDHNVEVIMKGCKFLKKLILNDCERIVNFPLVEMNVEKLGLNHCLNLKLDDGLMMTSLSYVSLNHLDTVNQKFIEVLTQNCPVIVELNLSNCQSLNDICVEAISTRLNRLRFIDISWCKSLTKLTEYSLWKCKMLRFLLAQGQERLGMSIILMFAYIKSLHVLKIEETFTRCDFEARKYSTTHQKKLQNAKRCLAFIR